MILILPLPGASSKDSRLKLSGGVFTQSEGDGKPKSKETAVSGINDQRVDISSGSSGAETLKHENQSGSGILTCIPIHGYPTYTMFLFVCLFVFSRKCFSEYC